MAEISNTDMILMLNVFEEKVKLICETTEVSDNAAEICLQLALEEFGCVFLPEISFSFAFTRSQDLSLVRTQSDIKIDLACRECRIQISPQSLKWGFNSLLYGRVGTLVLLIARLISYNENVVASLIADPSDGLSPLVVWNGKAYDYPSLAYSSFRPDSCLIADPFFVRSDGYAELRQASLSSLPNWSERSRVAVWRGAAHGHKLYRPSDVELAPEWAWHQRLHLCAVSKLPQCAPLMDVGITSYDTLPAGDLRDTMDGLEFKRPSILKSTFANYRYIIDVDGFSNSWPGLFSALLTGSCVLKIGSALGFKQWYYDRLVPWKNFVPVSENLEDLPERLEWVNANDNAAQEIGEAGRRLALSMSLDLEIHRSAIGITEWIAKQPITRQDYDTPGELVPKTYKLAGATTVEEAVVNACYRKLLGREPDRPGLEGGMQSLRNIGLSQGIEIIIGEVLSCPEFLERNPKQTERNDAAGLQV